MQSRAGAAFPINKVIRKIQGRTFVQNTAWRGNIIIAKYQGGSDPSPGLCHTSIAEFPILKNYLSTAKGMILTVCSPTQSCSYVTEDNRKGVVDFARFMLAIALPPNNPWWPRAPNTPNNAEREVTIWSWYITSIYSSSCRSAPSPWDQLMRGMLHTGDENVQKIVIQRQKGERPGL